MKGNSLFFSNELSEFEYFAINQPIGYLKTFVLLEEKIQREFLLSGNLIVSVQPR